MTEVLNFTVYKNLEERKYRIATEFKNGNFLFYLQRQKVNKGFIMYDNVTDEFWVSLDFLVASSTFQNLFK